MHFCILIGMYFPELARIPIGFLPFLSQLLARACFRQNLWAMSPSYRSRPWRTTLCPYGSKCVSLGCPRAHSLAELLPPDEAAERLDAVWKEGVDRWFGQILSQRQIELLMSYYQVTPTHMVPLWMHGLLYVLRHQNYVEHLHFSWDYDLSSDLVSLQDRRSGPVPFVYMESLWEDLEARRRLLAREQAESTETI